MIDIYTEEGTNEQQRKKPRPGDDERKKPLEETAEGQEDLEEEDDEMRE